MIKRDELTHPNSCMSRARDDEMVFVLLGRDPAAAPTVRNWCSQRVLMGKNKWADNQIQEALNAASVMEQQAREPYQQLPKEK